MVGVTDHVNPQDQIHEESKATVDGANDDDHGSGLRGKLHNLSEKLHGTSLHDTKVKLTHFKHKVGYSTIKGDL